ncbi:MAG: peptide deformylase [Myxococcota bacterium]|jgi:peptide deformylase|nr:peptide deformylase [Myxococcota bacterium]
MTRSVRPLAAILTLVLLAATGCTAHRRGTTVLDPTERYLIVSLPADEPMALVLDDSPAGDRLLRTPARPLDLADPATGHLADRMLATVLEADGVGIAAVQVGIPRALLWAQRFDLEGHPFEAFVNPEVLALSDKTEEGWEGCLSVCDIYSLVDRAISIELRFQALDGELITETVEGFTAVILQHELDHLEGILFTDRADSDDFVSREEYLEIKRLREEANATED